MKARRLSPAEAVERGRRLLAQRRAREHWADVARRLSEQCADEVRQAEADARCRAANPWTPPGLAETTEPRRSPPAPERWPRVWRQPTLISGPTIVAAEINAADGVVDWLAGGAPAAEARPATKPEKPADLSTNRTSGRKGGAAKRKPRPVSVSDGKTPAQNIPRNIPEPGAGIPVTERNQRVTPSSPPCSKLLEIEQGISNRPEHPPGAWPIADLGERQCRFACTPNDAPSHRFCGAPTKAGPGNLHGSWCEAHLPLVWGQGTRAERMADWTPKRVRVVG